MFSNLYNNRAQSRVLESIQVEPLLDRKLCSAAEFLTINL
jgi:hypothetical protein